ncbi:hypothetical protein BDW02DRAFT_571098 [Decorospora gaudefroyi]|uniref:Uncharacterized protein n=1 Tax=Decorospora gaudefroyi TaxID=184978 RepID=A0A6A5KD69_9PLEO|nr:hypothetical protein BDW02DRAFT_571098 [Decorospora gaudefroyi]
MATNPNPQTPIIMSTTTTPTPTYKTYTNATPQPFTPPTTLPTTFPFGPANNCASNKRTPNQPKPLPNHPLDRPATAGACAISNDADVNEHAFWDLYACCEDEDFEAKGDPFPCTALCRAGGGGGGGGQSVFELGECLSKRVGIVVCSLPLEEDGGEGEGGNATVSDAMSSGSASATGGLPDSTGGANVVGVVQSSSTMTGLVIFGILAFGSAAGMFL